MVCSKREFMNAQDVQLQQTVTATSAAILDRYRNNRDWMMYQKEWIYRNFPAAGKSWLDFGCGTGEITTQLALLGATSVIAMDVLPGLVEMAQRRAEADCVADRVRTICADVTEVPPEPVDAIVAFAVLHHVPDRLNEVIAALRAWLKPGGLFVYCEPVSYLPALEWLRDHSGVSVQPLDPGERKLNNTDLEVIESHFERTQRTHFHTLTRLSRVIPSLDRPFRQADVMLRHVPGSRFLAGCVVGTGHAR